MTPPLWNPTCAGVAASIASRPVSTTRLLLKWLADSHFLGLRTAADRVQPSHIVGSKRVFATCRPPLAGRAHRLPTPAAPRCATPAAAKRGYGQRTWPYRERCVKTAPAPHAILEDSMPQAAPRRALCLLPSVLRPMSPR